MYILGKAIYIYISLYLSLHIQTTVKPIALNLTNIYPKDRYSFKKRKFSLENDSFKNREFPLKPIGGKTEKIPYRNRQLQTPRKSLRNEQSVFHIKTHMFIYTLSRYLQQCVGYMASGIYNMVAPTKTYALYTSYKSGWYDTAILRLM